MRSEVGQACLFLSAPNKKYVSLPPLGRWTLPKTWIGCTWGRDVGCIAPRDDRAYSFSLLQLFSLLLWPLLAHKTQTLDRIDISWNSPIFIFRRSVCISEFFFSKYFTMYGNFVYHLRGYWDKKQCFIMIFLHYHNFSCFCNTINYSYCKFIAFSLLLDMVVVNFMWKCNLLVTKSGAPICFCKWEKKKKKIHFLKRYCQSSIKNDNIQAPI